MMIPITVRYDLGSATTAINDFFVWLRTSSQNPAGIYRNFEDIWGYTGKAFQHSGSVSKE